MGTDTENIKNRVQMAFQYQSLAASMAHKIYSGELIAGQRLNSLKSKVLV